jgi:hypothetical protein
MNFGADMDEFLRFCGGWNHGIRLKWNFNCSEIRSKFQECTALEMSAASALELIPRALQIV